MQCLGASVVEEVIRLSRPKRARGADASNSLAFRNVSGCPEHQGAEIRIRLAIMNRRPAPEMAQIK